MDIVEISIIASAVVAAGIAIWWGFRCDETPAQRRRRKSRR